MEKKLTDEEIVRALKRCRECDNCFDCPIMGEMKRRNLICREVVLDLIHRLQGEVQRLAKVEMEHIGMIAEQKAEIERLTEENNAWEKSWQMWSDATKKNHLKFTKTLEKLCEERNKNAELQKQVEELLNRRIEPKIFQCHADALENCPKVEQAVKDTAKEALEAFICKLVNSRLVSTKEDLYVEMLETKDDLLKECYGVEVE